MSEESSKTMFQKFENAVKRAYKLPNQSQDVLLEMYGLYKQAIMGDVTGNRPGGFDIRNQYKYDAWAARKGMSTEEAMRAYINLIDKLEI